MPDHHTQHPTHDDDVPAGKLDAVKDVAAKTADQARHAFESSRDGARDAAKRAAQGVEANPLVVVAGGLAVGALVAALVPRSRREKELLAPVGKRIAETGAAAIAAAKERGFAELDARGLSADGLRENARSLFDGLGKAASSAGGAAAEAARTKGTA